MQADTHLLPSQPATHVYSTSWREYLLCQDYTLSPTQLQYFYELKQPANVLWEEGTSERWDLIQELSRQYFGQVKRSGKEWMRLGFQGMYPQTDFRGGGIMSLQLILRYVRRNKALVQRMEGDRAGFFFAITAINIAFFMRKYFHLADFLKPGQDSNVYCPRRALKNFCRVLESSSDAYYDLHQLFLTHFYGRLWHEASLGGGQVLLQFNSLFQTLTDRIKASFQNTDVYSLEEVIRAWHGAQ